MNDSLFLGTYPGIDQARLDYVRETLTAFLVDETGIRP